MIDNNEFYLTLIRHGQSIVNAKPDLMGQDPDTPLSDKGKMQSIALGNRLRKEEKNGIDLVFSSPYIRAYDTCVTAMEEVPHTGIKIAHDLREYSAGDWNNASRRDTLTLRSPIAESQRLTVVG